MCTFISFIFKPKRFSVKVWDLTGHSQTYTHFNLIDNNTPNAWRKGHYTPDGTIICRCLDLDSKTGDECAYMVKEKWPTFSDFLNWSLEHADKNTNIDLRSLTSAEGLKLPDSIDYKIICPIKIK